MFTNVNSGASYVDLQTRKTDIFPVWCDAECFVAPDGLNTRSGDGALFTHHLNTLYLVLVQRLRRCLYSVYQGKKQKKSKPTQTNSCFLGGDFWIGLFYKKSNIQFITFLYNLNAFY